MKIWCLSDNGIEKGIMSSKAAHWRHSIHTIEFSSAELKSMIKQPLFQFSFEVNNNERNLFEINSSKVLRCNFFCCFSNFSDFEFCASDRQFHFYAALFVHKTCDCALYICNGGLTNANRNHYYFSMIHLQMNDGAVEK